MKALALPVALLSASALVMALGELVKAPSPIKPAASVLPPSPLDPAWWSTEDTNTPIAPSGLRALRGMDIVIQSVEGVHRIYQSTNLTNWTEVTNYPTLTHRHQTTINRFEPYRFFTGTKTNQ